MKILVLGAQGMIGHRLFLELKHHGHDVYGTSRSLLIENKNWKEKAKNVFEKVDLHNFDSIETILTEIQPAMVINAAGIVKQNKEASDAKLCQVVNAVFPHRLAYACFTKNIRLLHLSTDCVFDGKKGNYTELDFPSADDIYGQTKFLGEVHHLPNTLTIRTSTIGRELKNHKGMLDWFLQAKGEVSGFSEAYYTGFTTVELARIIHHYILPNKDLSGLYHVAGNRINKFDLLTKLAVCYHKNIQIHKVSEPVIKRDLLAQKFTQQTSFNPFSWDEMLDRLVDPRVEQIY